MALVKAMLFLCVIGVLLPQTALAAAAADQPGITRAEAATAADQPAEEAWIAALKHKKTHGKHENKHTGHHGHRQYAGAAYPGAGDPFYPQAPKQPSWASPDPPRKPAWASPYPRKPAYTPEERDYAGDSYRGDDSYRHNGPREPYYPATDPREQQQQYDQRYPDPAAGGPDSYYYPKGPEYDNPDPDYYGPGVSNQPRDSDYYRSYPRNPNAGEPGTHTYHNKRPVLLNGPQKCDFEHGELFEICLQEVSRTPAGLVVSPEVSYNPTTEFTSSFGCCVDSYEPYEDSAGSVPVGHCHWSVTQGSRTALSNGEKLGTVTATCNITDNAPCVHPLGLGATFKITTDWPQMPGWIRIPAALPAHFVYEDGAEYPNYAAAAAAPDGTKAAAGAATPDGSQAAAAVAAAARSAPAAGSSNTKPAGVVAGSSSSSSSAKPTGAAAADPSYGGSKQLQSGYRGEKEMGDDKESEDETDNTEEAENGGQEGYGDSTGAGGAGAGGEAPAYQYDGLENAPYYPEGNAPYEEQQQQQAPGWYEGPFYPVEGTEGQLTSVRGKADNYRGLVTAVSGPGSGKVHCGKVDFLADFIDSTGEVLCPPQPDGDPNGYTTAFNGTAYDSRGAVPLLTCGTYRFRLVRSNYGPGYRGRY